MNYRCLPTVGNIHVFLDISVDDVKCGRVVVELFKNHVPKTVENFRALCTGEKGMGELKLPLHYKNSIFHKAVPECLVQGGDIINFDGTGGESIYGPYFEDESLDIMHSDAGMLSMANCGIPNTNNSQFCVTLGEAAHLDGAYVVFGRIVKGFSIINDISYQPVRDNFRPIPLCKIWDCGELKPGQDWGYCDNDLRDVYPPYPEDWECDDISTLQTHDIIKVVTNIKDAGNHLLKQGSFMYALTRYRKALRYLKWYTLHHIDDREELMQTTTQCHLNAALACLKAGFNKEAILYCNQILEFETNAKALFRRAMARENLNDHQDALCDLHAALQLAPDDGAIQSEINRINRFLLNYHEAERLRCARMFRT